MLGDLTVDVMPELESILGFTNRWYGMAREESDERELPGRVPGRIVRAPLFLATKVEAFGSRGAGDFAASQDIEDIVAVVDGRPAITTETGASPPELRHFLAETAEAGLRMPDSSRPFLATSLATPPASFGSRSSSVAFGRSRTSYPPLVPHLCPESAVRVPPRETRMAVPRRAPGAGLLDPVHLPVL